MRSILIAVFVLACSCAHSQTLKMGLSGGMSYNGTPAALKKDIYGYGKQNLDRKGSMNPVFRLYMGFDTRHWEIGAGAEVGKFKYEYSYAFTSTYNIISQNEAQFIDPYIFVNRKINLPKSYIYMGISAGYLFHSKEIVKATLNYGSNSILFKDQYKPKSDILFGAQIGYCVKIGAGFSVNAEAAMRYANLSSTEETINVFAQPIIVGSRSTFFYFPVTVGISHKI